MKKVTTHIMGLIALAASQVVFAQSTDPLKDAAQRAISTNPEVTAKFNAFRAAVDEVDVARGGYLPRVDLSAEASRTRDRVTSNTPPDQTSSSTGVALSATQLLWDGFATQSQVERLDHARMTRYFEFLEASEQTALETVRAFVDVARSRQLVKLAEENYVRHRQVYELMQSRTKAGVGKGVDLEQANARLALAESNLTTETANLHDVTERYRRIVGTAPPAALPMPRTLDNGTPSSITTLLDTTAKRNTGIAAAVENLRAAQSQAKERDSLFQPKVEARVRSGIGNNLDGVANQKRDTTASLVMNWNLYNGGADTARVRQSTSQLNFASDARDKACRDARQTAAVSFNDVRKLNEQLVYLDRNVLSSEKARDAYRQQFDNGIDKRTLLDVLNAENELYTARRTYTGAEHDLVIAKARTQASISALVAALGLSRTGTADSTPDISGWAAGEDSAARCPLTPTELTLTSKGDLDARAHQQLPLSVAAPMEPAMQALSSPVVALATPQAFKTAAAAPVVKNPPITSPVSQRLIDWSTAWSNKDVTRYLSFYDPSFKPKNTTRSAWFANRTKLLKREGPIDLKISNVQRKTLSPNVVETTFDQVYTSKGFKDKAQKTLTWKRAGTEWYIVKESNR
jgi:adhesin transport system outer membrane protein